MTQSTTQSTSPSTAAHTTDFLAPAGTVQPPRGPLLVASDASEASDAAFPMARIIAAHTRASVQVISALRPNAMPTYAFNTTGFMVPLTPELLDRRAEQVTSQVERLVPVAGGHTPWPVAVRAGDPVREIVLLAHELEARLVVVGRGRHNAVERVLGGESVLRLLQLGETPILAVEPALERLPRRIVVATDFSVFSIYATEVALTIAAPDATVEFVHVAPDLTEHSAALREFAQQYRAQVKASFAAMVDRLHRPGMTFETTMLEGNASTRLLEHLVTHPADLVVSATHGYGFLRRMMLGSVAAELVRGAPCSVLCVPGTARTLAAARAQSAAQQDRARLLPMESLDAELSAFTARYRGRPCTVEVHQRDIGAHAIGHHLPLAGITYEAERKTLTLMFGAVADAGRHLSHQVHACVSVEVVSDGAGREHMLRIRHGGGETLVHLE